MSEHCRLNEQDLVDLYEAGTTQPEDLSFPFLGLYHSLRDQGISRGDAYILTCLAIADPKRYVQVRRELFLEAPSADG